MLTKTDVVHLLYVAIDAYGKRMIILVNSLSNPCLCVLKGLYDSNSEGSSNGIGIGIGNNLNIEINTI